MNNIGDPRFQSSPLVLLPDNLEALERHQTAYKDIGLDDEPTEITVGPAYSVCERIATLAEKDGLKEGQPLASLNVSAHGEDKARHELKLFAGRAAPDQEKGAFYLDLDDISAHFAYIFPDGTVLDSSLNPSESAAEIVETVLNRMLTEKNEASRKAAQLRSKRAALVAGTVAAAISLVGPWAKVQGGDSAPENDGSEEPRIITPYSYPTPGGWEMDDGIDIDEPVPSVPTSFPSTTSPYITTTTPTTEPHKPEYPYDGSNPDVPY